MLYSTGQKRQNRSHSPGSACIRPDGAARREGYEGSRGAIEIVGLASTGAEAERQVRADPVEPRCPTCGQHLESPGVAAIPGPPVARRWRVQYWRNPVPRGTTAMELGVFTPEGELLYAAPLTEKNEQLAQAVVAAMNAIPSSE